MKSPQTKSSFAATPAVILAAGENSRFFPLNTDTHKGAISLGGQPLVLRTLQGLADAGFRRAYLIVAAKDYGGRGLSGVLRGQPLPLRVTFVLDRAAAGMGNSLLRLRSRLRGRPFAVCFPYSLAAGRVLTAMRAKAGRGKKDGTVLAVTKTAKPWLYGIVSVRRGRVAAIVEKPARGKEPSRLKLQGVYLLGPRFMEILAALPREEYAFEEALHRLAAAAPLPFVELKKELLTLKYPWHLLAFKTALSRRGLGLSATAKIARSARFVGPCYVGAGAVIGPRARLEDSFIEDGARLGPGVTVRHSVILGGAVVKTDVSDSIIGPEAVLGRGVVIRNRGRAGNVVATVKGQVIDTGLACFGAVIGSRARVGDRAVISAGVFLGAGAVVKRGETVNKNIPHQK